jgi:hypothetical protein
LPTARLQSSAYARLHAGTAVALDHVVGPGAGDTGPHHERDCEREQWLAGAALPSPSGRNFGVTGTFDTSHVFAGAFADVLAVEVNRNVSWHLGAELGMHRISDRYSSFDLFPKKYQIVSAPNGVFLPYAGARFSVDRTRRSGSGWGFQIQARQDLIRERHTVLTEGWKISDMETQAVGGRTVMVGFYIGRAI